MTPLLIIDELKTYEKHFADILSRFSRTKDGVHIAPNDNGPFRQYVREVAEFIQDALGDNSYSKEIVAHYNQGIENYLNSPSYASVERILAVLRSVITRLNRFPELLHRRAALSKAVPSKADSTPATHGQKIFIGHGHSDTWLRLKDFLTSRLKLSVEEFNAEPIAGITNISRLNTMLSQTRFAFLVLTAEDEKLDGHKQARMNVIHEVGLFQGRLGFNKAIVLLEDGCDEFSNIAGLGQIRFPKNDISLKFEEIRRVLEREKIIQG